MRIKGGAFSLRCVAAVVLMASMASGARAEPKVSVPAIPNRVFRITDFGAVGDGKAVNTAALQKAIAACGQTGGGTVLVPPGRFLTRPFTFVSRMNLHLEKGAALVLSSNTADYTLPPGQGRNRQCIEAIGCHDVALTGQGAIDGQGASWWPRYVRTYVAPSGAPAPIHRPYLVVFTRCTRVLVQDVSLINSPSFHLVPSACRDVAIRGVHIKAPVDAPNTDGIDPSGWNVSISRCTIDVGDDCIAVKPSALIEAGQPSCRDFAISDCTFLHGHGLSVGGQTPGGLQNMTVRDCTFQSTAAGIRMKANRGSGGSVENVSYDNLTMKDVRTPILITSYYPKIPRAPGQDSTQPVDHLTPVWRHIHIRNVTAEGADVAGQIIGLPEMPVSDVTLTNVRLSARKGMQIVHAKGVQFVRSQITTQSGPPITQEDAEVTGLNATGAEGSRVFTVAPDAHGDAAPIQAAIDAVPPGDRTPVLIQIAPGAYVGPILMPKDKQNVTLRGLGKDRTQVVLTAGAGEATLTAAGKNLRVENLTLENTAGQTAGPNRALMCTGDRQVYENVLIKGWQDTLWAREPAIRLYFHNCDIWGSVDFIYGAATALFDHCDVTERRDTGGPLTAPSTPQEQPFGLVFLACRLVNGTGGMDNTTLGRPWRSFGASSFVNCVVDAHVKAEGWSEWAGREKTCRFCEYGSRNRAGAALDLSHRVSWAHRLTSEEARRYTLSNIFRDWNPTDLMDQKGLI